MPARLMTTTRIGFDQPATQRLAGSDNSTAPSDGNAVTSPISQLGDANRTRNTTRKAPIPA
jgi:hypothetical protein